MKVEKKFKGVVVCLDYIERMLGGDAFIAETIYIRKNRHWMLYGFIFEWDASIGRFQFPRINFLSTVSR